ncbi:hypothetical protein HAX54_024490 [Datura stramonium]|uniref:Uncharacterized protein n=1 Tax=Datura stramonium TaxID=4076 RepID=A0ABS8UZB8_DATST|nr:hypothetical protein [Datura stramonium]
MSNLCRAKKIVYFNNMVAAKLPKMQSWHGKLPSPWRRMAVLIKSVLQALLIPAFRLWFNLPKTAIHQIERRRLLDFFSWEWKAQRTKRHWIVWNDSYVIQTRREGSSHRSFNNTLQCLLKENRKRFHLVEKKTKTIPTLGEEIIRSSKIK